MFILQDPKISFYVHIIQRKAPPSDKSISQIGRMVGKGSTRIHISDTGFMIFLHVSFQGVVGGVLVRAGVVGVVEAASTSDPASKQASKLLQQFASHSEMIHACKIVSWQTAKMSNAGGCAAGKGQILDR